MSRSLILRSSKSDKVSGWHLLEFNVGDNFYLRSRCERERAVSVIGPQWTYPRQNITKQARQQHFFLTNKPLRWRYYIYSKMCHLDFTSHMPSWVPSDCWHCVVTTDHWLPPSKTICSQSEASSAQCGPIIGKTIVSSRHWVGGNDPGSEFVIGACPLSSPWPSRAAQ